MTPQGVGKSYLVKELSTFTYMNIKTFKDNLLCLGVIRGFSATWVSVLINRNSIACYDREDHIKFAEMFQNCIYANLVFLYAWIWSVPIILKYI